MYRTILVGTDGSPTAGEAVAHAAHLAKAHAASLHIVAAAGRGQVDELRDGLVRVASDIEKDGVQVRLDVAEGDPVDVLLLQAGRHNADLIVVGSWGRRSGGDESASIPARLVQQARRHVLVVETG